MNASMPLPNGGSNFFANFHHNMLVGAPSHFNTNSADDQLSSSALSNSGRGSTSPSSFDADVGSSNNNNTQHNMSAEDASKSFPLILHTIVSDTNSDNSIHWLPCGTRFVISNKDIFSANVLPRYFGSRGGNTTKFTSFTRRLKRWNFSRVPSGREMGAYYHEGFRRGDLKAASEIMYPESKSQAAAKAGGGGGSKSDEAIKEKKSSPRPKKAVVPKARRRASTGCIAVMNKDMSDPIKEFELSPVELADISPTPIKSLDLMMTGSQFQPPPFFENDENLKDWLTGSDILEPGPVMSSSGNDTPSVDPSEPAPSVVSNTSASFLLAPPSFPSTIMSQQGLSSSAAGTDCNNPGSDLFWNNIMNNNNNGNNQPKLMRPGAMRRHSTTLENLKSHTAAAAMSMPMTVMSRNYNSCGVPMLGAASQAPFQPQIQTSQQGGTGQLSPSSHQLLGNNFACVPEAASVSSHTTPDIGNNHTTMMMMPTTVTSTTTIEDEALSKPLPLSSNGSGGESFKDPFNFSREFSFDDLNTLDPFT